MACSEGLTPKADPGTGSDSGRALLGTGTGYRVGMLSPGFISKIKACDSWVLGETSQWRERALDSRLRNCDAGISLCRLPFQIRAERTSKLLSLEWAGGSKEKAVG